MTMQDYYVKPDWTYVSKRLNELRWELDGLHTKITEIELLKYYEDDPQIKPEEKNTGQRVKSGLTADLMEQVKAAILANRPLVHGTAFRKKADATTNLSKREKFWQAHLDDMLYPVNIISELVDSQLMGLGVLKGSLLFNKWNATQRRRKRGEQDEDFIDRVTSLKKYWGPPIGRVVVHPVASFFRPGENGIVEEFIEESYKPKTSVMKRYETDESKWEYKDVTSIPGYKPSDIAAVSGQPMEYVRPLPSGFDTTNYCKVTEYWNPGWYQVYVNNTLVHEESDPAVRYFIAPGRSSSSKDPDKFGISVSDYLRHNEPIINRLFSRMVEAAELIVNKRNTLQVPESYTPEMDSDEENGTTKPRTWTFTDEYAEALPAGAEIVDPFKGAEAVFQAIPVLQMMIQMADRSGVSPLFKGISPGAAGSGYRDNSLYLMAKAAFDYIILSLQACISAYINWCEWLVVNHVKQEIYIGELSISPADIKDYPANFEVELKPTLPQNLITEGEFWERQRQVGNVSRRFVREHGLGIEQPDEMDEEVNEEDLWEQIKPILAADVVGTVYGRGPMAMQQQDSGLVGPDGNPISSQQDHSTTTSGRTSGGTLGRESAGRATAGQPRRPPNSPGTVDSNQGER